MRVNHLRIVKLVLTKCIIHRSVFFISVLHHNIKTSVTIESFHMISDSDPDIVSWTGVGDSFTIKDIEAFQKVRNIH